MTSFIAFHEEKGIYLGAYMGHALFSNSVLALSSKAIRFDKESEIHEFFGKALPSLSKEIVAVPVETTSRGNYVDLVDILKSGHTKHTETLLDNLPAMSDTIH